MKRPILPSLFFALWSVQCGSPAGDLTESEPCSDGKWNGRETDFDCGGPACGPCEFHKACLVDSDCASGVCERIKVCAADATLTGISPAQSPDAGGTLITLTGTGFTAKHTVTIDGIPADDVKVISATQITARAPRSKGPGKVDVAVGTPTGRKVTLAQSLTYQFTYGFVPTDRYTSPVGLFGKLLVADINRDQKPDLVFVGMGSVSVMPGTGQGTFGTAISTNLNLGGPVPLVLPGGPITPAVTGDLNSDGKPDLAFVTSNGVSILPGDGLGGFGTPTSFVVPGALVPLVGDLNGDGKPDLVVVNNSNAYAWTSDGMGGLLVRGMFPVGPTPIHAVLGDFNGDKRLDVVAIATGSLSLLAGDGMGGFGAQQVSGNLIYPSLRSAEVVDLNRDQKLTILMSSAFPPSQLNSSITETRDFGDGILRTRASPAIQMMVSLFAVGDFDGDGKPDLALAAGDGTEKVSVLLGNGSSFGAPIDASTQTAMPGYPNSLIAMDLNSDGKSDLTIQNGVLEPTILLNVSY